MVRYAKIVLILAVAFYGVMGVFNFIGFERGMEMVRTIISMSDVPAGRVMPWSTDSTVVAVLGVLFIGGCKVAGGILCGLGAWRMWSARAESADVFNESKGFAVLGCAVLLVLFFGGFMYLAASFFGGFQTELGQGSAGWAFQLGGSVGLILLFVNQPDR